MNDHGSSNQRYAFSTDTYGSLFGASLDLKSDLMAQQPTQIGFTVSTASLHHQPQQQQHGLQNILSAVSLQGSAGVIGSHHPVGLTSIKPCSMNSTVTPTIYTIEDHGGGNPLINLTPSGISGGNTAENEASNRAQHKKRKLSMTECFPTTVEAMSNKSPSVKQEPRKYGFFLPFDWKLTLKNFAIEPSPVSLTLSPRQISAVGADEDYSYEFSADSSMFNDSYQCIRFQAFQQSTWHLLFDGNFKEL